MSPEKSSLSLIQSAGGKKQKEREKKKKNRQTTLLFWWRFMDVEGLIPAWILIFPLVIASSVNPLFSH